MIKFGHGFRFFKQGLGEARGLVNDRFCTYPGESEKLLRGNRFAPSPRFLPLELCSELGIHLALTDVSIQVKN